MLVEFSVVPMGIGVSISKEVAKAIDIVDKSGLPYRVTAMGTIIEGSWQECFSVIKKCHDMLKKSAPRIYTRIVIDDKGSRKGLLAGKVSSVEKKLGRKIRK
jgi:uncharacterized protein (TIGR00106 family)